MRNILVLLFCCGFLLISPAKLKAQTDTTLNNVVVLNNPSEGVNVAFKKTQIENITGAITVLDAVSINKYDNNIWVSNALAGRTLGMIGNNSIRGVGIGIEVGDITGSGLFSGNAMFVVDGLPRDIEGLRLSEVESITILKDINSAILYGSAAVNGVVLITTKRGKANRPTSNVILNYGLSKPRELPKFLNSADYMTYFNRARVNDGLTPQFTDAVIENHRSGNPYRYPSTDYYSDEFLRPFKTYHDIVTEFSGGDDNAKFYTNVGWNSTGGLLNFGEGKNARNNQFNVRGNVDLKVNRMIKTSIDAAAFYGSNQSQRGNYWERALVIRPHEYTPLLPISLIDPENPLLGSRKNDVNGEYLLGGNTSFVTTPFGDSYAAGNIQTIYRKFTFNNRIDFDLASVTPGLSAHSNISFDYLTGYTQTVANEYSVYAPTWSATEDKIISLTQHGRDTRPGTQVVGGSAYRRRVGFYGQFKYDRTFANNHRVTASLIGFGSSFKESGDISVFQGVKNTHLGFQAAYTYASKYIIDFSANYANSVKLSENNRRGFSPSVGLSWMLNKEAFLSSVSAIDYLKLRVSAGILKSDIPISNFFLYDNRYNTSGSYNWYEGTRSRSGVVSGWSNNDQLDFARRNEINLGLDGLFFNKTIEVQANVFYNYYNNLVVRPNVEYPSFYDNFVGYENFEADKYTGAELGITYNKSIGNWTFMAGVNALYITSKRDVVNEIWDNDYQNRAGRPRDAYFGLKSLGYFKDQADVDNSPIHSFGTVRPGDLKYQDQNNDGIINANDEVYLGRWQSPFSGGIQARVGYKNLSLYVLGEGSAGSTGFTESNYFRIDGNRKYSEVVLGSWTPETAGTATYPRLSSQTSTNNFRRSDFWQFKQDYFQIRRVQLTYSLPEVLSKKLLMSGTDIFANASDLFQMAKNPREKYVRAGSEPLYRTFSLGVRANF
ncbi:SusC/RagA family TonB-linked outer membrane protein [Dyadobacter sp. CY312]|uniref:SusC/RagA family TonB-linked outer membrane protein n=1 Tax=Dyadobacter sp. CY312 TaxID=2907303 RepID=UPI001F34952A|nr:SusC/RagA family TonB-linked outer membrane protein [Dyadobacter sp. CY312]MCE7040167.1 SusC/RagA family TonB-linked outer membrane protein [Dyadobacter sp. CY312]